MRHGLVVVILIVLVLLAGVVSLWIAGAPPSPAEVKRIGKTERLFTRNGWQFRMPSRTVTPVGPAARFRAKVGPWIGQEVRRTDYFEDTVYFTFSSPMYVTHVRTRVTIRFTTTTGD